MCEFTAIPTIEYEKICKGRTGYTTTANYLIKLLLIEKDAREKLERFIEIKGLTSECCYMLEKEVANA